uniref:Uncharacterized protein n=1 Tax=viral metagenome TaxID=1070528 RepID=A0A6C0EMA9_9ZZZZ
MTTEVKKMCECGVNELCEHLDRCYECQDVCGYPNYDHKKHRFKPLAEDAPPMVSLNCLYCVMQGTVDMELQWDSYGENVTQVMAVYAIGYRDGFYNRTPMATQAKKVKKNVDRELVALYILGYQTGQVMED